MSRHLPHDESFSFKNTLVLTVEYHALSLSVRSLLGFFLFRDNQSVA